MRAWRRAICAAAVIALGFTAAQPLLAQDAPPALLTLDQERFFLESSFGRASVAREEDATRVLEDENKQIESELVTEEQALTELRRTLPAADFAARAEAFDQKVERIRTEQDTKARDLTRDRDTDRQAFLRAAVPVLGTLMSEKGALAIIDKAALILSLSAMDVTDEAIARVDAALKTDESPPAP